MKDAKLRNQLTKMIQREKIREWEIGMLLSIKDTTAVCGYYPTWFRYYVRSTGLLFLIGHRNKFLTF